MPSQRPLQRPSQRLLPNTLMKATWLPAFWAQYGTTMLISYHYIILILRRIEVNGIDWIQLWKVRGRLNSNIWDKTWFARPIYIETPQTPRCVAGFERTWHSKSIEYSCVSVVMSESTKAMICSAWDIPTTKFASLERQSLRQKVKTCCFWSRLDSWTESTKTRRAKTQSTFAAGFLRTTSGIISWWMNRCTHLWPNGHTTVRWWLTNCALSGQDIIIGCGKIKAAGRNNIGEKRQLWL